MLNFAKYIDEFNEYLDEPGEIIIGLNFSILRSQILFQLDETAYNEQLHEFVEQKRENFPQVVYETFPAPIAYFFHRAQESYDNENNRLQLLRSTWEALIYVLYGVVIGEVNHKRFSLRDVRIFDNESIKSDHRGLMSYKLGWKIEVMQKIIEYDKQKNDELSISHYIQTDVFEVIRELNQKRNDISHMAALSEQDARDRYTELYPKLLDLLFELEFLQLVTLLRYRSNSGDIHNLRFNGFDGHSLQGRIRDKEVSDEELLQMQSILNNQNILLEFDDMLFNISPFIHFHFEHSHLRLCYFKKINRGTGKYTFEIIGGTEQEISIDPSSMSNGIVTSLRGLL